MSRTAAWGRTMPDETYADLVFPDRGLDTQAQVGDQRPGTTPEGVNVRALDPRTMRLRGASRCGLSRFIDARVGGLTSVVQHLAVIVDPTTPALLTPVVVDDPPPDAIPDPSIGSLPDGTPRIPDPPPAYPPGGNGIPPNRNVPGPDLGSGGGTFATPTNFDFETGSGASVSVALGTPLAAGDLVVVGVAMRSAAATPAADPTVADNLGHTGSALAEEAATHTQTTTDPITHSAQLFYYRVTSAGTATVTVTFTPALVLPDGAHVWVASFPGGLDATPLEAQAGETGTAAASSAQIDPTTGAIDQGDAGGRLLVCFGAYYMDRANQTLADASSPALDDLQGADGGVNFCDVFAGYTLSTAAAGTATADVDITAVGAEAGFADDGWAFVGAVFTD